VSGYRNGFLGPDEVFVEHKDYCCLAFGLGDGVGLGDWGLGAGCSGGEAGASSGTDTVPSSLTATRRRTFGVTVSVLGADEIEYDVESQLSLTFSLPPKKRMAVL
jgi:hypothetical protein